jgi:hypothetical protein
MPTLFDAAECVPPNETLDRERQSCMVLLELSSRRLWRHCLQSPLSRRSGAWLRPEISGLLWP